MANNLIKNETNVFYTVKSNDELSVREAIFYGGKVDNIEVTREDYKVKKFPDKKTAQKVAAYVNGKLIKHTRTEVITEVTEEFKLEEEK